MKAYQASSPEQCLELLPPPRSDPDSLLPSTPPWSSRQIQTSCFGVSALRSLSGEASVYCKALFLGNFGGYFLVAAGEGLV